MPRKSICGGVTGGEGEREGGQRREASFRKWEERGRVKREWGDEPDRIGELKRGLYKDLQRYTNSTVPMI